MRRNFYLKSNKMVNTTLANSLLRRLHTQYVQHNIQYNDAVNRHKEVLIKVAIVQLVIGGLIIILSVSVPIPFACSHGGRVGIISTANFKMSLKWLFFLRNRIIST